MATEASNAAITRFRECAPAVRGCAVIEGDSLLAATGDGAEWLAAANALLGAADRAAGSVASHAHVATEAGEVYAVRSGSLAMVAVTGRFTLSSLTLADMRAALRDVAASRVAMPEAA